MGTHGMDKAIFSELRQELLARRAELIALQRTLNDAWQRLHQPSAELEETASMETRSKEMQQRGEIVQTEIRNIDAALTRMAEGDYGSCEACGRPIRVKRLQAVPWARHCVECAGMREKFEAGNIETPAVAAGRSEMSDEELREAILDELQTDGRVETEELVISVEDGVVYLEGFLPSEAKHQVLLELLHDALDIEEVVDDIRIDRQLWERESRRPDHRRRARPAETLVGEEEEADVDAYTSLDTNEPMAPPDELTPEDPRP